MNRTVLTLRHAPTLRLDARLLQPAALAAMSVAEVESLRLPHGRDTLAVGELAHVTRTEATDARDGTPTLLIDGDASRYDRLGCGMADGLLRVTGSVGDHAGLGLAGGRLEVLGSAGDLAACAMRGGWLDIAGDCGDLAASALPGDMDGMRGGTLVVRGNAGHRLADRMRRGTVVVLGNAGDHLASRMVAGTLALAGRCGARPGYGMRRGSLVFAGPAPTVGPTFTPVNSNAEVFWQLLARDLARFGGAFTDLPGQRPTRLAGDLAVQGRGELLMAG